jgi:hypothetical protein
MVRDVRKLARTFLSGDHIVEICTEEYQSQF